PAETSDAARDAGRRRPSGAAPPRTRLAGALDDVARLPAGRGDGLRDRCVVEVPPHAIVARGAHDGLGDAPGDVAQIADRWIETAVGQVGVGDETGETLRGGQAPAVGHLTRLGHAPA